MTLLTKTINGITYTIATDGYDAADSDAAIADAIYALKEVHAVPTQDDLDSIAGAINGEIRKYWKGNKSDPEFNGAFIAISVSE